MEIALLHNYYDEDHLAEVTDQMRELGAPVIRAVRIDGDTWQALEGCHRLRAAHALGLVPTIVEIITDDEITSDDIGLDWQDNCTISDYMDRSNAMISYADVLRF